MLWLSSQAFSFFISCTIFSIAGIVLCQERAIVLSADIGMYA